MNYSRNRNSPRIGMRRNSTRRRRVPMSNEIASMVNRMITRREEHKKLDSSINAAFSTAGSIANLTPIAQGTGGEQRLGDVVRAVRLEIRHTVQSTAVTADNSFARIIVFRDTSVTGSTPAVTDVLQTATTNSNLDYDNQNSRRFLVLYDHLFACTEFAGPAVDIDNRIVRLNFPIYYNASTALKNQIFVLYIATSANLNINGSYRLVFTDA